MHSSSGTLADSEAIERFSEGFEPNRSLIAKLAFPIVFFAIGTTLLALFVGILRINNGTFLYTLDDPYIHLALSDQIRHGNYGLYPGTHAAPSSSILFPFLLAVAAGTPVHPYFPLLINVCALFFTVEVMRRLVIHLKLGTGNFAILAQAGAVFLLALCFNLIGVVFTGLEHSLHIATVAAIVYGLALFLDSGKMPGWLPVVIVLCPLLRYEGLALSVGAILALALRGRLLAALATLAATVALVGSFSAFLIHNGLPPLPSSILSKSSVAAGGVGGHGGFLPGVEKNVNVLLNHPTGMVLLLIGVMAACVCVSDFAVKPRGWTTRGLMAVVLLSAIGGHAVAGRFGWFDRYEDYILLGTGLIGIYLAQDAIRGALADDQKNRFVLAGGFAAVLLVFCARYWNATLRVPIASNNIYEQQLQMHSFIDKFYRGPVAINDLGLSSYHNPSRVLDLGGLGSEEARRLISLHASAADYEAFVAANDVHLVMVYQEWFTDQIPASWKRVGTISLSRERVSAAHSDVQFYATDEATADRVRSELEAFQATLPARVKLTLE